MHTAIIRSVYVYMDLCKDTYVRRLLCEEGPLPKPIPKESRFKTFESDQSDDSTPRHAHGEDSVVHLVAFPFTSQHQAHNLVDRYESKLRSSSRPEWKFSIETLEQ